MLSSLVRCSSQCTDWSEQDEEKGFFVFLVRMIAWKRENKIGNYPRHPHTWGTKSPKFVAGSKYPCLLKQQLEKVEMPPKKKRKVESNKPTQGNKQGKTKNYRLVVIVLSTMTEWHAKIGCILSCQAWPTAQRQQSWFAEEWARFSVYIASSKHEGGSVNSRQLCKPERQSIEGLHNFEEYGVQMRLCEHLLFYG